MPDRLGVGEHAGGDLTGPVVVLDGPGTQTRPRVLVGQLPGHLVGRTGVQELQRLGEPPVQQPSSRGADQVVGGLPQQVVGEVVAAAQLAHDAQPPELVDGLHHVIGGQVGGLAEQLQVEVASDRCREPGHLPAGLGQLLEPAAQHGSDVR